MKGKYSESKNSRSGFFKNSSKKLKKSGSESSSSSEENEKCEVEEKPTAKAKRQEPVNNQQHKKRRIDKGSSSSSDTYLEEKPYKFYINEKKRGTVGKIRYGQANAISAPNSNPVVNNNYYVVNIPVIASKEKKSVKLQKIIQDESFGTTAEDSAKQTKNRVSLAIGVNKPKSIIPDNNSVLYKELNTPLKSNYPCKRIGYFWKPEWEVIDKKGFKLNLYAVNGIAKKYKLPTLVQDLSTQKIYIYGKWLTDKPVLSCLGEAKFKHLFENRPLPQSIDVSYQDNKELFNFLIEMKYHSGKTRPVTHKRVRSWYANENDKEKHISEEENKPKLKMIPYREIRDKLKDSEESMSLLGQAQKQAQLNGNQTYLMFFDSSTESLRATDGTGVLTCYDNMIVKYKKKNQGHYPELISTGYRIDPIKYPLDSKGVRYDMDVRTKSNKYNPNSIYPPEPNFGVLTLAGQKVESFSDGEKLYDSPAESLIFVKNIMQNREITTDKLRSVFKGKHAIQIEVRPRMLLKSKGGERKEYQSSKINFRGEYINWDQQDFKNFRNTSQSHFKPKDWAKYALDKHEIRAITIYEDNEGRLSTAGTGVFHKKHELTINQVRNMLVSLLTKVFTAYDPISISNKISKREKSEFETNFVDVMNNYYKRTPCIFNESARKENANELYHNYFDQTQSLEEIKQYLCLLSASLGKDFEAIRKAAAYSGSQIYENIFYEFLTGYPQIVDKLAIKFFNEYFSARNSADDFQATIIQDICEDNFAIIANRSFKRKGRFQLSYLHLAALAGNTGYVKFILENKLLKKNIKANYEVLPLHCALAYYIQHDEDYDFEEKYANDLNLIELLADEDNLWQSTTNGVTALYLVFTRLSQPEILINHLYKKNCIGITLYNPLILYATMLQEQEIPLEAFNNPFIHIIEHIDDAVQAAILVELFAKLGVDANANHRKKEDCNEDSELDLPLFLAIHRDDPPIVKALGYAKADFCDVYDFRGLPPLLSVICDGGSLAMLKTLYDCGASLTEENLNKDTLSPALRTCAFFEIIRCDSAENLAFLQYIVDNCEPSKIRTMLVTLSCELDDSEADDEEDLELMDMIFKDEKLKVIDILFFNEDGSRKNEIMDLFSEETQRRILDLKFGSQSSSLDTSGTEDETQSSDTENEENYSPMFFKERRMDSSSQSLNNRLQMGMEI